MISAFIKGLDNFRRARRSRKASMSLAVMLAIDDGVFVVYVCSFTARRHGIWQSARNFGWQLDSEQELAGPVGVMCVDYPGRNGQKFEMLALLIVLRYGISKTSSAGSSDDD